MMKNLKTFEQYSFSPIGSEIIKKYGDPFPISKLSVGDRIVYMGVTVDVIEVNEAIVRLVPIDGGREFMVNQNMFNDKGFIGPQSKVQKLEKPPSEV